MKVLVIDDDINIVATLKARLPEHGFIAETALTGKKGLSMARINTFDLLIVDMNLPDMQGEKIVEEVRKMDHVPRILMFTVVSDTDSKVRLLNSGADDYLVKPFAFDELLARIRALLRRSAAVMPEILSMQGLTLDTAKQTVQRGDHEIRLTRKEFALLERLMRERGAVVSKGALIEHAWDSSVDPFSDSFDTHMTNLRKKLGPPLLIHTVHGRGYKIG